MAALINIRAPENPVPHSMLSLANRLKNADDEFVFDDIVLPQLPPRQPAEIVALLKKGFAKKISLLEWINVFQSHEYFAALSHKEIIQTYDLIWAELRRNQKLQRIALWRICLYFDGQTSMMPNVLLKDCLIPLKQIKADKPRKSVMATIAVVKNNTLVVADYSLSMAKTPTSLFASLRLPSRLNILNDAKILLEKALAKKGIEHFSANYISIIECYSDLDCDQAVQRLLSSINEKALTNSLQLLEFLKLKYAPSVKGTRWQYLDRGAQATLREIIGSAWFGDFKKFIFQITKPEIAKALDLNITAITQLKSRVTFWSNYQTRFHSFKIFLPLKTSRIIQSFGLHLPEYAIVDGFRSSLNETELCILEFDKYVIVEYLRGGGSSLKVFDKSDNKIMSLLSMNKLRIGDLGEMSALNEHDHLIFWQHSCEEMLRVNLNILPNYNLIKFLIKDSDEPKERFSLNYDSKKGLPSLSNEQRIKRYFLLTKIGLLASQKETKNDSHNTKKKNLLGMYQNCLVTHTSRSELGIGIISKMHAGGYIDVEFKSDKFSGVSANNFRVV